MFVANCQRKSLKSHGTVPRGISFRKIHQYICRAAKRGCAERKMSSKLINKKQKMPVNDRDKLSDYLRTARAMKIYLRRWQPFISVYSQLFIPASAPLFGNSFEKTKEK
jgi:hypothetical protein